jgi:hypothetical protein
MLWLLCVPGFGKGHTCTRGRNTVSGIPVTPIRYPGYLYDRVMARTKTRDGKRVGISSKFSELEAAEIDAARGGMQRGPWLRQAALAAARGDRGPAAREDLPEPVYFGESAPDCRHPSGRVEDGVCQDCGQDVWLP